MTVFSLESSIKPSHRLGVIGMSPGNGHPFSWSAIINGYDDAAMAQCPFPAILKYLRKHRFPDEAISGARVTHVWTQDPALSRKIADAALVDTVVDHPEQMIGHVDGILLARDDARNHAIYAAPFLHAGLPVYIDKPLALSVSDAENLFSMERYEGQIFTCTALRFASEFILSKEELARLGSPLHAICTVPKSWETYAIHAIEPVLRCLGFPANPVAAKRVCAGSATTVSAVLSENRMLNITATGHPATPIRVSLFGQEGSRDMVFCDSFGAFRSALEAFIAGIGRKGQSIPKSETLAAIEVLEIGCSAQD